MRGLKRARCIQRGIPTKMKSNPAIFFLFFGLSIALIYRHPKNSVGAFDNREIWINRKRCNCFFRYSVKRFNIPYREPENGLGPLDDIDHPDTSVFRNLENIYEMVLEAKSKLINLAAELTNLIFILKLAKRGEDKRLKRSFDPRFAIARSISFIQNNFYDIGQYPCQW